MTFKIVDPSYILIPLLSTQRNKIYFTFSMEAKMMYLVLFSLTLTSFFTFIWPLQLSMKRYRKLWADYLKD